MENEVREMLNDVEELVTRTNEELVTRTNDLKETIESFESYISIHHENHMQDNVLFRVHDNYTNQGVEVEREKITSDEVCLTIDVKELLADYLSHSLQVVVEDEYGNILEERSISVKDDLVEVIVSTDDSIEDAVGKRLIEESGSPTLADFLSDLGISSIEDGKARLAKLSQLERLIST